MYIIKARFNSNVKGVYSEDIETSDNEELANRKFERMLDRWFDIICKYNIDYKDIEIVCKYYSNYDFTKTYEDKIKIQKNIKEYTSKLKLFLINDMLEFSNNYLKEGEQKRTFEISIEKNDD